jgi:glucose/mannose-6-phosphate isomerase
MNPAVLDDAAERARLDPGGMLASVAGLPEQCQEAWAAATAWELPASHSKVTKVIIAGMGGSAIAGDLWRVLLQRESAVPVFNIRQYDLPPFVDRDTLVIASSFSGDTEETLSALRQALPIKCPKIVITAGGQLLATARANGIPFFTYDFQGEPRAALGWSLMPLLAIAEKGGFTHDIDRDVREMAGVLTALRDEIGAHVPLSDNLAKQAAVRLHDKLPVVYGAGPLIEVAHRWKTQLNESSKVWAFHEELPEIHHNAIIGYALPKNIARDTAVVFLHSDDLVHLRVQLRYDFTRDLLARSNVESLTVEARGVSALAQLMSLVFFGDYVSGYLALLYGVDPTPTTVIDELKAWLATQE